MPISTEATQLGRLVKAQDEAKYRRNDVQNARGRRPRRRATEISARCAEKAADAGAAVASGRMFDVVADHIIDAEVARWSAKVPLRHPIPQPPIAEAADLAAELLQQPAAPVIGLAPHDDRTLSEIPGLVVALSGTRIATKYRGAAEN